MFGKINEKVSRPPTSLTNSCFNRVLAVQRCQYSSKFNTGSNLWLFHSFYWLCNCVKLLQHHGAWIFSGDHHQSLGHLLLLLVCQFPLLGWCECECEVLIRFLVHTPGSCFLKALSWCRILQESCSSNPGRISGPRPLFGSESSHMWSKEVGLELENFTWKENLSSLIQTYMLFSRYINFGNIQYNFDIQNVLT